MSRLRPTSRLHPTSHLHQGVASTRRIRASGRVASARQRTRQFRASGRVCSPSASAAPLNGPLACGSRSARRPVQARWHPVQGRWHRVPLRPVRVVRSKAPCPGPWHPAQAPEPRLRIPLRQVHPRTPRILGPSYPPAHHAAAQAPYPRSTRTVSAMATGPTWLMSAGPTRLMSSWPTRSRAAGSCPRGPPGRQVPRARQRPPGPPSSGPAWSTGSRAAGSPGVTRPARSRTARPTRATNSRWPLDDGWSVSDVRGRHRTAMTGIPVPVCSPRRVPEVARTPIRYRLRVSLGRGA